MFYKLCNEAQRLLDSDAADHADNVSILAL